MNLVAQLAVAERVSGGMSKSALASNALLVLGVVLMLVDLYLIFMVAPTDSVLGHVQRVFYFHVPLAVMSFLAFFLVFIGSIAYLVRRFMEQHLRT